MPFEEAHRGVKHPRVRKTRAQVIRGEAGERNEPRGPGFIAQDPDNHLKRNRSGIIFICFTHRLRLRQADVFNKGLWHVTKRVMVVEDNELNLKLFSDLLQAHGHEVAPVKDARDALSVAATFRPEIIVMDIQMPYISGLELIEQIRRDVVLRRTPVMAVTAYAGTGDEDRIRDAGADAYVSKPITLAQFMATIETLSALADSRKP
jgi:two-component system, cell cycle response regulator DivK